MYNLTQILYISISLVVTIAMLVGVGFIKNEKFKNVFLKFWAVATFVLHISIMWVDYLQNGVAEAQTSILFAIYFCNACMYLLLVVAFIPNKKGKLFKYLATFVAYAGTFGALITVLEIHYFAGVNPQLNWMNLKSMLSHSAMLVGCLYLFVGRFVKIRVSNLIPVIYGLLGCLVIGAFNNWLFVFNGLPNPNSMYLVNTALESVPLFNGYFLGGGLFVIVFIFTAIWEMFACKKGKRWYNRLAQAE